MRLGEYIGEHTLTEIRRFSLPRRNSAEGQGLELAAIYHSHTHTAPYPSQTDINFAANWPGLEWVIIGLADEQPQVRSYLIDGAEVKEVSLEAG